MRAPRSWLLSIGLGCAWAWLPAAPARALLLPCTQDDSLSETAAEYLLSGRRVDADELVPLARRLGFDGVALHAHDGLDDAALAGWLKGLGERADAPLVCGEAVSEQRRLVLVAVRAGRLRDERGLIRGELAPRFKHPALVVEGAGGETERIAVSAAELGAGVRIKPELLPYARLQLVAEGPQGPRPVAELVPADASAPAPASGSANPDPRESGHGARSRPTEALLARIDATRRSEGARPLRGNQLLQVSAQRHAQRVCELGKVAHRLGEADDPETRLREEHIAARSVGEAVARSASSDAALSAIFRSPSHRLAVTDKAFTDVGIGQAFDAKGHSCVVVLLAAWPRRIP
jgi:uncharacterized protein YkwD